MRFEDMLPQELVECANDPSIILLPLGAMTWYGPHMSMGFGVLTAHAVGIETAKQVNGVVFPPLYIGTEKPRSPEELRKIGFKGGENIIGIDFPSNTVKSFYWPETLCREIIRTQIGFFIDMGFRNIFIVNGHGASNHIDIINGLCADLSDPPGCKVTHILPIFEDCGVPLGHAALMETAFMMHMKPENVDLSKLPARGNLLFNTEYAIVDGETFEYGSNDTFSVRHDPRDATPELGKKIFDFTVSKCVEIINKNL
jgi:creatinine amidohydrolase